LRRPAQLAVKHPQNTRRQINQLTMMFGPPFIRGSALRSADHVIWTMEINGAGTLQVRTEDTRTRFGNRLCHRLKQLISPLFKGAW